jgi:hypothetical protein
VANLPGFTHIPSASSESLSGLFETYNITDCGPQQRQ